MFSGPSGYVKTTTGVHEGVVGPNGIHTGPPVSYHEGGQADKYHPLYFDDPYDDGGNVNPVDIFGGEDNLGRTTPVPSFTQLPPPPLPLNTTIDSSITPTTCEPNLIPGRYYGGADPLRISSAYDSQAATPNGGGFNYMNSGSFDQVGNTSLGLSSRPIPPDYGVESDDYYNHSSQRNPYWDTTTPFPVAHNDLAARQSSKGFLAHHDDPTLSVMYNQPNGGVVGLSPSGVNKTQPKKSTPKWATINSFPLCLLIRPAYAFKCSWDRRTRAEKVFLSTILASLFTIFVLGCLIRARNAKSRLLLQRLHNQLHPEDACLTPFCVSLSARLLNSMNLSTDPCHDFYEYSCGGWIQENHIPDGQSSWNNFLSLYQKNQYILRQILESKDTVYESKSENQARVYYGSCLDENDTIELLGARPVLDLQAEYGGWNFSRLRNKASQIMQPPSTITVSLNPDPGIVLETTTHEEGSTVTPKTASNSSIFKISTNLTEEEREVLTTLLPDPWDFQTRLEKISHDLSLNLLFSVYVSDDDKNSTRNVIFLDTGRMSLPKRDYYLNMTNENVDILTAYLKYMIGVGLLLASKQDQMGTQKYQREQKAILLRNTVRGKIRYPPSSAKLTLTNHNATPPQASPLDSDSSGPHSLIRPKKTSSNSRELMRELENKISARIVTSGEIVTGDDKTKDKDRDKDNPDFMPYNLPTTSAEGPVNGKQRTRPINSTTDKTSTADDDELDASSPYAQFYKLVTKTMTNILAFETRLANITPTIEDLKNSEKNYVPMTVQELQTRFDFIDWSHYLNALFEVVNYTVVPEHLIIVRSMDYFTNLTLLVKEYLKTREEKTILNNYFMWHLTSRMIPYLSQEFRATLKPLTKALKGVYEGTVAWKTCLADTNNIIGFPLGSLFVKYAFKGKNKFMAESMINKIKDAFKAQLPTLDWMDEETRLVAAEKADAIRNKIGFPDFLLKPKELDKKYDGLELEQDEYFANNLRQLKFYLRKDLDKITKPVDKTRWSLTPPTVNAYYLATGNEMVFPAGILQSPFYDVNFPKSLNFGAMGFVVGHELTHGFDDQGRQFDKNGNLKPWWNNVSIEKFNSRARCLEKQYSTYKLENLNINGKQTIGENIADNGGLKATFTAYRKYMENNKVQDPILPGLNLTDNQLFFLAFAQVWCSIDTKKSLYFEILNDMHSPNKIRVIGTVSNSIEFSKAYGCPANSPMNPSHKCIVW